MTQEEAQAYLIRARDAPRDIAMLDTESQWVQDGIARLRKMQMRDEFTTAIASLKRYARNIDRKRKTAQFVRKRASALIDRVPDARGREILRRRYMERETWEQIGAAIMYDPHYCTRLCKKALSAFGACERMIEDDSETVHRLS